MVGRGHQVWVYQSSRHPFAGECWKGVRLLRQPDPEGRLGTFGQFIYDFFCLLDARRRGFDILLQLGYTSNAIWFMAWPSGPVNIIHMDGLEWKRTKYTLPVRHFLRWMERLRARMAEIWAEEVPAIVTGDFNVIPEDKDVWSPPAMADDALMQPQSRDAYARLLGDGWTDAIDLHNPRGGVWTYWDYQAGAWQRDHGFRIDHALLSPELGDRLAACGVDKAHRGREKASDHAPIWVELRD